MFRKPIKEVNAEFQAEEKNVESLQRIVKEACMSSGLSKKNCTSIMLAIEEAATNIIRHAYLYEKGTIKLKVVIYSKLVVFSLIDTGRSFNPDAIGAINLDKLVETGRKGGLGFYLIQKIMDSVEYISTSGVNEMRMIKRISVLKPEARPLFRRFTNLRVKFSFWTFLLVCTIVASAFYFIDMRNSSQMKTHLDETIKALGTTVADQASGYLINQRSDVEFDQMIVSYIRSNTEIKLLVLTDANKIIVGHSGDITSIRKPYQLPAEIDPTVLSRSQPIVLNDKHLNYLMIPIVAGRTNLGTVHLVYSADKLISQLESARYQAIMLTLTLLLFGVIAIYFLSQYFVRPIARITEKVRQFTSGEHETELPLEGAEEFFEISRAFNQMLTRLNRDKHNIVEREKLAKEIEVASVIQRTLLPGELPNIPGLEVDAYYKAASTVGGDLYDVFPVSEDKYCLTVADVSGKGVPASLVMSMLRTVIQIYSYGETSSKTILSKVNDYISGNIPPGIFVTVMLLIYDAKTKKGNFASAGHNPLFIYEAETGNVIKVNPKGMPLGITETIGKSFEEILKEYEITLKDNDLFFLFTDGLTEAVNSEGVQYGTDKLSKFLGKVASESLGKDISTITNKIRKEFDQFRGDASQHDDISFILARKQGVNPISENKPDNKNKESGEIKVKNISLSKKK